MNRISPSPSLPSSLHNCLFLDKLYFGKSSSSCPYTRIALVKKKWTEADVLKSPPYLFSTMVGRLDSSCTIKAMMVRVSSLFESSVLKPSFSKKTSTPAGFSFLVIDIVSRAFLTNFEIDFVIIKAIFIFSYLYPLFPHRHK